MAAGPAFEDGAVLEDEMGFFGKAQGGVFPLSFHAHLGYFTDSGG
jgi:hypothetical protein